MSAAAVAVCPRRKLLDDVHEDRDEKNRLALRSAKDVHALLTAAAQPVVALAIPLARAAAAAPPSTTPARRRPGVHRCRAGFPTTQKARPRRRCGQLLARLHTRQTGGACMQRSVHVST